VNPFFFGASARQLFGAYEPAAETTIGDGAVLCAPFGDEYFLSHSAYRLLARQLSHSGCHALRFDYFGTGDSAGDFEEADQDQWLADIGTAIAELRDVAQVTRIALVGLRYGAALAAMAAREHNEVDRLVLWDPVVDGAGYLATIASKVSDPSEVADVRGVGVKASLREQISNISLETYGASLPKTLLLSTTHDPGDCAALAAHLRREGVDVDHQHVPDVAAWIGAEIGAAALPVKAIKQIVTWLT
jgi:pimeloyl-ACP methyl ester carboxylesterase